MAINRLPYAPLFRHAGAAPHLVPVFRGIEEDFTTIKRKLNETIDEVNNIYGSSGHVIEEDGVALTNRSTLNFQKGIVASDSAPDTVVNLDYETNPALLEEIGSVSLGSLDTVARADHIHPQGTVVRSDSNETITANWTFSGTITSTGGLNFDSAHYMGVGSFTIGSAGSGTIQYNGCDTVSHQFELDTSNGATYGSEMKWEVWPAAPPVGGTEYWTLTCEGNVWNVAPSFTNGGTYYRPTVSFGDSGLPLNVLVRVWGDMIVEGSLDYDQQAAGPSAPTSAGNRTYSEQVSGKDELHSINYAGDTVQITSGAYLNAGAVDHSGLLNLTSGNPHTQYNLAAGTNTWTLPNTFQDLVTIEDANLLLNDAAGDATIEFDIPAAGYGTIEWDALFAGSIAYQFELKCDGNAGTLNLTGTQNGLDFLVGTSGGNRIDFTHYGEFTNSYPGTFDISGMSTVNLPSDSVDAIGEVASGIKTGSSATKLVTYASGSTTAGNFAAFDANGDLEATSYDDTTFAQLAQDETITGTWVFDNHVEQTGLGSSTFFGYRAGYNDDGTTNSNTAFGHAALFTNTSGSDCVALGRSSLYTSNATHNIGIGRSAGYDLSTGDRGIYIGSYSGQDNQTGVRSIFIGYYCGGNCGTDVDYGSFLGAYSGRYVEGDYNTGIGYSALAGTSGSGGSAHHNQALGGFSLTRLTTGTYNTAVGYNCGAYITSGSNNIILGSVSTGNFLTTESDKLVIENSNTSTPLIYGDFSANTLEINGDLEVEGDLYVDDYVSINTTSSPYSNAWVGISCSASASIRRGLLSIVSSSATGSNVESLYFQGRATQTGDTVYGMYGYARLNHTGTTSVLGGGQSIVDMMQAGTATTARAHRFRIDASTAGGTFTTGNIIETASFNNASASIGTLRHLYISTPSNGSIITNQEGIRIGDLTDSTNVYAIRIDSQNNSGSATKGNIDMEGGDWNTGHIQLGSAHIWFDGTNIRGKTSAPTSASDGTIIV